MVKFLPCSHKHCKHEVFPQYEFFHEFHMLESMQMFYCSIYKKKAFLRYEQFDEISHYWDFGNVYHKSCIEMVFRYRGSLHVPWPDFRISERISCEESVIFFVDLAYIPNIIQNHLTFGF